MTNFLPNILITGGHGQLATAIRHHLLSQVFQVTLLNHSELDIVDHDSIQRAISQYRPDIIINTAAYTAVDKAEQEVKLAMDINALGAKNLALACQQHQLALIHLSTDYIFDGKNSHAYQEDDVAHPLNVYGKSKWLGEEAIREQLDQHIIVRVSGVFSEHGNNFVKTISRLAEEKKELRVINDQITCPTYADSIANALFLMLKQKLQWGTYHFCSAQPVSWYDFAIAIIEEAKRYRHLCVENVTAIASSEYQTAAQRPHFSILDCSKIYNDYCITQPSWLEGIKHVTKKLFKETE